VPAAGHRDDSAHSDLLCPIAAETAAASADDNESWDIFLRDDVLNTTTRITVGTAGEDANDGSADVSMSADGRYVVFDSVATNLVDDDGGGHEDIFLYDADTQTIELVSLDDEGGQINADSSVSYQAVSDDGDLRSTTTPCP
jgi:Tol biopolymer transport system component